MIIQRAIGLSLLVVAISLPVGAASATTTNSDVSASVPADSQTPPVDPDPYPQPPADFDPLDATSNQLAEYGFPATDLRHLPPGMEAAYAAATTPVSGELLPSDDDSSGVPEAADANVLSDANLPSHSANWAGKEIDVDQYNEIYMEWTVPNGSANGGNAEMVAWPGIGTGSDSAHDLLQAGTREKVDQYNNKQFTFWYEVYPQENLQAVGSPSVSAGDKVFVDVSRSGANASFFVENETAGTYHVYGHSFSGGTGGQAQWILERPRVNGQLSPLPFFGSAQLKDCYAWDTTKDKFVAISGPAVHYTWDMYNSIGQKLVDTQGLTGTDNQNFLLDRTQVALS